VSLFKQRKNKNFNYKTRFHKRDEQVENSFESQWQNVKHTNKRKEGFKLTSLPFLFVFLVMALILWYFLNKYGL
jgi:Flp pilus assembly protein TadB